jgi:hypothetical protein
MSSDWVEMDIPTDLNQNFLVFNELCLRVALVEIPNATMPLVECPDI